MIKFALLIREYRKTNNLSRFTMAMQCGITPFTIEKFEKADGGNLATAAKIAQAMGLDHIPLG